MVFQTLYKNELGGRKFYGRATRSDKKKQIKIPVDEDLYYFVHKLAKSRNMSATMLVTDIVSRSLKFRNNLEIFKEMSFENEEYPDDTLTVNCKLPQLMYDNLSEVALMWQSMSGKHCSIRKAAYRILMFELRKGVRVK